ncbi:hypothetical protein GOP47_0009399 [Adiantum capillus-veneris]|uniref:Calcyclin-binding protein n=1 Tax=Adiantum capillus-veneris TaxID=13818 RepID=A0A9D4ZH56_ADICA|nr:hypothetical protein GOP47_0009399 [Adiantum capillus-veneris]
MAADLRADVAELKILHSQARRPYVQVFFATQIQNLEKLVANVEAREAASAKEATIPEIQYTNLSNLTWEQDNERVKIQISLEGVEEDKVESKFTEWSFDVKFHDVEGKNYRCTIQKVHKEMDPDACRVVVKPKRVIISLRKLEEEDWKDLHFKEDKSEEESKREPMERLLEMMRNMYDDGDDEMKKTISDAWTTYRSTYKPGFKKPIPPKRR